MQRTFIDMLAGLGMGLLVGLLLGLSSATVVGSVVAALAAILGAFFGLSAKGLSMSSNSGARVASFGISAAVALLFGIEARSHNWLGAQPAELAKAWEVAGIREPEAAEFAAYSQLGIMPTGRSTVTPPKPSPEQTMLFSASESDCDNLDSHRFKGVTLRRMAFTQAGGDWARVADLAATAAPAKAAQLLDAAYTLECSTP